MNLTELIRVVKNEFGDEASVVIDDTDIIRWANDGQLEIVRRTDSLETNSVVPTVIDQTSYVLASALKINRVTYDGAGLVKISKAQLNKWYPDRGTTGYGNGTPNVVAVFGNKIEVYPKPAAVKNLTIFYVPKPTPLSSPGNLVLDIPEEMHDDLVQYCLRRAFEQNGDWQAASIKDQKFGAQTAESMAQFSWNDADSYPVVQDVVDGY